jgi:hypothetical protein
VAFIVAMQAVALTIALIGWRVPKAEGSSSAVAVEVHPVG